MGHMTIIPAERIFGSHHLVYEYSLGVYEYSLAGRIGVKRIVRYKNLVPNNFPDLKLDFLPNIQRGEANLINPWHTLMHSTLLYML